MPRRRRRRKFSWPARIALAILAIPLLYILAALIGGLIPVNASWREPDEGITIYLANNGVHADLVLPANAQGLDWRPLVPKSDMANVPADAQWIAFGAGERRVYLETPTWGDLSIKTAAIALTGGERVMHVEWIRDPAYAARAIRLTPEQYRRLWASIRAGFELDARRQADPHRPSRLWRARRFLPWHRQGQCDPHLQPMGRQPPAPRRGQGAAVVAVRAGAGGDIGQPTVTGLSRPASMRRGTVSRETQST